MPDVTTLDPDTKYFALPDDYAGAQPSALQSFMDRYVLPGQMGGGAVTPLPTPYDTPAPQPAPTAPAGGFADPTMAAPFTGATLPALQSFSDMQASAPTFTPAPAPPPQMPAPPTQRSLPGWAKALATLSALSGGGGAQIAGNYLQAGDAKDQQKYGQALQQYQLQQQQANFDTNQADRDRANAQDQTQQQFQNAQAQARALNGLQDQLQGQDAATQQRTVESLMGQPQSLTAFGLTPDALRAQFYDKDGNFQPMTSAADARGDAATSRAQTAAMGNLLKMTPAGQQALHDQFAADPDAWEKQYGVPYDGFTPGMTQRDTTSAASQASRAAVQSAQAALAKARAKGVPQQIRIAQGRLAEAVRNDDLVNGAKAAERGVQTRGQDLSHQDRQAQQRVELRGQNLRAQDSDAARRQRQVQFMQTFGLRQGMARERQYEDLLRERQWIQGQTDKLNAPADDGTGLKSGPSLIQRGRVDEQPTLDDPKGDRDKYGNIHQIPNPNYLMPLPNAPMTPDYQRFLDLQARDAEINKQQYALMHPAPVDPYGDPADQVPPGGTAPAPVVTDPRTGRAAVGPDGSPVRALPAFGGAAPSAVFRSRAGVPTAIGPSSGFGVAVSHTPGAYQAAPAPAAPQRAVTVIRGMLGSTPVEFHAPTTQAEFKALTPAKRQAYVTYLRQQKNTRFR